LELLAESSVKDVKVKLKELGFSGINALTREMAVIEQETDESGDGEYDSTEPEN